MSGPHSPLTLTELNRSAEADFVAALGGVFERAPWVAQRAFASRPFASVAALHGVMVAAVAAAGETAQLRLICAHPDLTGKAARRGDLTAESEREQAGAGLDQLSEVEYARFHVLNGAYRARFGFPFILAVKGHTKESVLAAFERRLEQGPAAERAQALSEIAEIARFRLEALVDTNEGVDDEGMDDKAVGRGLNVARSVTGEQPDLRYPIGDFEVPGEITQAQLNEHVEEIARLPGEARRAVTRLTDAQLDTPYRPGGWTVRQVVHHLPDSHLNSYMRFKLALTEDAPTIRPYDETRWAELADSGAPVSFSLALLDALHARWVLLLESLTDHDWQRTFTHPASGQTLTLAQSAANYAWHGRHHVAQIASLRKREGWG